MKVEAMRNLFKLKQGSCLFSKVGEKFGYRV